MKKQELGLSFRSEVKTRHVIGETARRYGLKIDFLGVYDDLGDLPLIPPLYEAACNLPKDSRTRLGAVGFALPKQISMVDIAGYTTTLTNILEDPNRVIAGLVPGAWMNKIGLKSHSLQQTREAIESLRYLLEKQTHGYSGNQYQIEPGFKLNYDTYPQVPVLLGAWGPKMAALAGELADQIKIGGSANPEMVHIVRNRLKVGTDKAGRDLGDLKISMGAVTVIHEDRNTARLIAREKAVQYIEVVGTKDETAVRDFPNEVQAIKLAMADNNIQEAVKHLPDQLANRFVFAGTPADIITQAEKILSAGADRIEFGTPHGIGSTAEEEIIGVDLLVNKVFPYFG